MAVSVSTSGIQSGSVGTEYIIASGTGGTFQLLTDLNNLQNGDIFRLKVSVEIFSGQPTRQMWESIYSNAMDLPVAISPPFPAPIRYVVAVTQLSGTSRAVPWAIYQY